MIALDPGEVICDCCNGKGVMKKTVRKGNNFFIEKTGCDKCFGNGKLDWIESIRGKEVPERRDVPLKYMTWSYNRFDEEPSHKKSSREILDSIDPKERKRIERKIAYNLSQ